METKKCRACLEEKELCEFRLSAYNDDRYSSKCKLCYKNKIVDEPFFEAYKKIAKMNFVNNISLTKLSITDRVNFIEIVLKNLQEYNNSKKEFKFNILIPFELFTEL